MLKKGMKKAAICMCAAILAAGAAGSGKTAFAATYYEADRNRDEVKGRILVSAGLEIAIAYNGKGNVVEIKGIDRDGKDFLDGQKGYTGKKCRDALKSLVRRLDEKGWFEKTSSSKPSLIIKTEKGSKYPDNSFMKDIEKAVLAVMDHRGIDAYVKVVTTQSSDDLGHMDKETMEKMVREQLGLGADNVKIKDYELDDGIYEIDALINGVSYEVELNAVTGEIVDMDRDGDHHESSFDQDDDDLNDEDDD